jgi:hypothetical protein
VSQWQPGRVWTQRELDIPSTPLKDESDFEACVATSYAMGLLYGGVTMPAPYTQAERERLEVVFREPQDLSASDAKALEVYGHRLRGPSVTSSKAAFLARPGLGFCLTGVGSPVGAQAGTFTHEVFAVAQSTTTVRVYDPLLSATTRPKDRSVRDLAAWMKGVGANQVREVRKDELAGADDVNLKGSNPKPIHNRQTTLEKGGFLVADPTASPFQQLHRMPEGTAFTPQWRVTGRVQLETDQWLGGWVFTNPPMFGYISEGLVGNNPLVPIEG